MPTNNFIFTTDDYDIYDIPGDTVETRPGSPNETEANMYFPLSTTPKSTMDQDPNNTGPTNDFWTEFPLSIDINGFIFYNNENTGINVRGPVGATSIHFEDLTEEQRESLKGKDGIDGTDGRNGEDGVDGVNGKSAYELWLDEGHTGELDDFYQYIADLANGLIKQGSGEISIIGNNVSTNLAGGRAAAAFGDYTVANGNHSFVAGFHNTAAYPLQTIFGKYNENNEDNIFEIGNGESNSQRLNIFNLTYDGNLSVIGDITDGAGNRLANKVNAIPGKQLSTNDFTNTYKNFIDTYQVDNAINDTSERPVQNKVIYEALENLRVSNTRPYQDNTSSNANLPMLFASNTSETRLNTALYTNTITWNPVTANLNTNQNTTSTYSNLLLFGKHLTAGADNQIIFGNYNEVSASDVFQIGNGIADGVHRSNLFSINANGDVQAAGEITDGNRNILSNKQDILQYDTVPVSNSTKLINSGNLYSYFNTNIYPRFTSIESDIETLEANVAANTTNITNLQNQVNNLLNPIYITDEYNNNLTYRLGVYNGKLYIQLVEEVTPPNEETQGGEEEENDNN